MDIAPDRTAFAGAISDTNPMGTDGFEFVEFTSPDVPALEALFRRWRRCSGAWASPPSPATARP